MVISAKPILIVCNTLSCILGVLITVLGTWISVDFTEMMSSFFNTDESGERSNEIAVRNNLGLEYQADVENDGTEDVNTSLAMVSWPLITVGLLIIFQNILGCFGAYKELKSLLVPYLFLVCLIVLAEILGLIMSVLKWSSLLENIRGVFELRLSLYAEDEKVRKFWNDYMNSRECCGVNNGTDFFDIAQKMPFILPDYCCISSPGECTVDQAHKDEMPGCIQQFIDNHLSMFRFDVCILVLEILLKILGTIASGIILKRALKGNKEFWAWKEMAKSRKFDYKMKDSQTFI